MPLCATEALCQLALLREFVVPKWPPAAAESGAFNDRSALRSGHSRPAVLRSAHNPKRSNLPSLFQRRADNHSCSGLAVNLGPMPHNALSPCPGCGALFPPRDGPTHRYLGASAGCWALHCWSTVRGGADVGELVAQSRIPNNGVRVPVHSDASPIESLWGGAYGVQHHGGTSPQAIQSVAVHLLDLHAFITGKTTRPNWALGRAIRVRGVFRKLEPPPLGSALTWRHLSRDDSLAAEYLTIA